MAIIHDKYIIELAEVIKGYGNNPDVEDPYCLSAFYRFYELPNIAVSRENFEKMRPFEPERKRGIWIWDDEGYHCSECFFHAYGNTLECLDGTYKFCPNCGADMRGEQDETN